MSTQLKDKKQAIYEDTDEWKLYIFINQHSPCSIQDLSKKNQLVYGARGKTYLCANRLD